MITWTYSVSDIKRYIATYHLSKLLLTCKLGDTVGICEIDGAFVGVLDGLTEGDVVG